MINDQESLEHRLQENAAGVSGNGCRGGACEPGTIIAASKAMREILAVVRRSAPTDVPVLILGEPDTGKRLIAREVHRQSRRAAGPFVHVACGAIREPELAETLFGHRESRSERDGQSPLPLVEQAHGGTLFLEEVSQLPLWGQARLVEVLQQGRHMRGAKETGTAPDVRVVASTTEDLQPAMAQRRFSSSLYYFLKVVEIHVPPLRHRPQDVAPLADSYLAVADSLRAQRGAGKPYRFAGEALERLLEYDWPGNALELASVVAHAVLLTDGDEIGPMQIAALLGRAAPRSDSETIAVPLIGGLKEMERSIIAAVIERCRGNKAAAARVLRLHRRTLYRILQDETSPKGESPRLPLVLAPNAAESAAESLC